MALKLAGVVLSAGATDLIPWKVANGYRYFEVQPKGKEGFHSMDSEETGVHFTNLVSRPLVARNRVAENGSGVALGDIDGDGWCDIYFCGMEPDNALYRNLGNWKFENITSLAGVALTNQLSTGAVLPDVDGDGDLDLMVNSVGGGTRLFFNDGKGRFNESTEGRLVRRFGSMSMSLADIDRDGDLDLYVANYRTILSNDEFPRVKVEARLQNGNVVLNPPGRFTWLPAPGGNVEVFELGERDFLYINNGRGAFAPVSWTNGNFLNEAGQPLKSPPMDWGLSVMMRDLNEDGLVDIVVCNDFMNAPDRIWLQEAGFKFRAAKLASIRKVSLASMAVDVADINRDGLDDLFFAEMLSRDFAFRQNHRDNLMKAIFNTRATDLFHRWEIPRNTLFLNRGDGTYAEIAELAGVDASEWSWGAVFLDVDLDGWEDLLIPTGHNHDVQNDDVLARQRAGNAPDSFQQRLRELEQFPRLATPIIAFRNGGDRASLQFTEMQDQWGLNIPGVANGFACGDLDNDGDLDLVANRLNDGALLLRNGIGRERIAVRLSGTAPNTKGIGAKISVYGGKTGIVQSQRLVAGGRYLSTDDTLRTFAATKNGSADVEVLWTDGTRSLVKAVPANRVVEIDQRGAKMGTIGKKGETAALFKDTSAMLNHRSVDPTFNDREHQPSLPYSLSTQGPPLTWADLDRDGRDDLVIGGARGGRAAILRNTATGFVGITNRFTSRIHVEDQMGMVVTAAGTNEPMIVFANSNYEGGRKQLTAIETTTGMTIPGDLVCPGALAMADIDSDGDLDLFVAGRALPRRYPAAASSRIYLNNSGQFTLSVEFSASLQSVGLVTSAAFSDFNDDGRPDLVVALELGDVRVYINSGKNFVYESRGMERTLGWWTSVVTGDFDKDGLTDVAAGNWGRNTPYERFLQKPIRFLHGDASGDGKYELFQAIYNPKLNDYVPMARADTFMEYFPPASERIRSYADYAKASVSELLRDVNLQTCEINTMNSMIFLNRGKTFEARALPLEVQYAPVFGMAVADFNNDGNDDIVLGQNLFETRWEMGKLDSGRPLLLQGDGRGGFRVLSAFESGLVADGQQRAVAVADFNLDGKMDVAMSQNNGETKLFENVGASAGVRIRFEAGIENPSGIGVRYRPSAGGAVRDIQAGSGWLSQNSAVQLLPRMTGALQVQWPGGERQTYELPKNSQEITVSRTGATVRR